MILAVVESLRAKKNSSNEINEIDGKTEQTTEQNRTENREQNKEKAKEASEREREKTSKRAEALFSRCGAAGLDDGRELTLFLLFSSQLLLPEQPQCARQASGLED